jgi:voltage-gated potassium channel Kch
MTRRDERRRDLMVSFAMLVLIFAISILFYNSVEGWSHLDCVYFVTMTLTAVGYGDVVPVTDAGKIFTTILVWVGISAAFFFIYSLAAYRDAALDRHVVNRLAILKNLATPSRSKTKPEVVHSLRKKIGEK